MSSKVNNLISLFSGCGGLDLGFHQEGFHTALAVDHDPAATRVFCRNLGDVAISLDVQADAFRRRIAALGSADIVLGGFPCQGFSKAGPKREDDTRNALYRKMLAAVEVLKPRVFVAENVDGMSQNFNGRFVQQIEANFAALGYHVEHRVLDAAMFGVPQRRRRIIFVGTQKGITFTWPSPTHHAKPRNGEFRIEDHPLFSPHSDSTALARTRTIRDAIGDLVELNDSIPDHRVTHAWPEKYRHIFEAVTPGQKLCNVRHSATSVYTWNIPQVFGDTTTNQRLVLETIGKHRRHKRYGSIPNGNPLPLQTIRELSGLTDIDNDIDQLTNKRYLKRVGDRYDLKGAMFCSGLFKRPRWDQPSPTVLTNYHNPRYFLHPSEDRPFSLRKCARLQGFPDDFLFADEQQGVSLVDGYRLVGNAVPPPLGRAIAKSVKKALATDYGRKPAADSSGALQEAGASL